jgi:hypothetical protein
MTRDEEKVLRFKQQRSKEAISLAMQARWEDAVAVNREIIESFPEDVDTYNRLGRAYMELGQYTASREAYQRAVQLDPYNAIAARNLRRLNDLKDTEGAVVETDRVEPHHFIEEIGKAGVVALSDLVSKEDRARLVAGDKVYLKVSGSALVVESGRSEYVGKVDSKYAPRLIRLMLGGNQYSASVVKSTADSMTVMIRETYQHPSQAGKLSFPPKGMDEFRPYASDKLLKLESEEAEEEESGYTIIGGSEIEVLPDESLGVDDDMDSEND